MTPLRISQNELVKAWGWVEDDVRFCQEQDSSDASLADVFRALCHENATLYVFHDDQNAYIGMVIAQRVQDEFSGEPSLHIWHARGHASKSGMIGVQTLDQIARDMGARYISYRCKKLSLVRWGERHGFDVSDIELRREVPPNGLS